MEFGKISERKESCEWRERERERERERGRGRDFVTRKYFGICSVCATCENWRENERMRECRIRLELKSKENSGLFRSQRSVCTSSPMAQ